MRQSNRNARFFFNWSFESNMQFVKWGGGGCSPQKKPSQFTNFGVATGFFCFFFGFFWFFFCFFFGFFLG